MNHYQSIRSSCSFVCFFHSVVSSRNVYMYVPERFSRLLRNPWTVPSFSFWRFNVRNNSYIYIYIYIAECREKSYNCCNILFSCMFYVYLLVCSETSTSNEKCINICASIFSNDTVIGCNKCFYIFPQIISLILFLSIIL